jgi:predicted transcriptional regulator of viral defense system
MGSAGRGSVFIATDFVDLAAYDTVRKALKRMVDEGILERVLQGLYLYPHYNEELKKNVPANPNAIAKALARKHNWTISPSGDTALNQLGLSTQVPAVPEYLSSGPYRTYTYGKYRIQFKHRTDREFTGISEKSRLVIQALKALGNYSVEDETKSRLARLLSSDEKELLVNETRYASTWIHEFALSLNRR